MEITSIKDSEKLTLRLAGRLDANSAPELSAAVNDCIEGVKALTFDFENLEYISSAGLRVLVAAQRIMNKQGSMTVEKVNSQVREVLDITGLSDVITIR